MTPRETIGLARSIVEQGLRGAGEERLLDEFCRGLVGAGVPLQRAYVAQRTLHPVIGGLGFEWRHDGDGTKTQDFPRGTNLEMWQRSPFHYMLETGTLRLRRRLDRGNRPFDFPVLDDLLAAGATDYLALGTLYEETGAGAVIEGMLSSWTSDRPGGFADEDVSAIEVLLPVLALAFKSAATQRVANNVVEAYLGRDAGRRVLSGEIQRGSVDTIRAVLWYCDLQGFTRIAESTPRERLIDMLNDYFAVMVDTVHGHGGQVLKFMGDGLLAIFRLEAGDDATVCGRALDAAEAALAGIARLNPGRAEAGLPVSKFYLALHLGDVMYGNIGAPDRLDFTVVGPAVNEASRIEAMCRSLDQDLVISSAFAEASGERGGRLVSLGRYALRGVRRPQELFTLARDEEGAEEAAAPGEAAEAPPDAGAVG